MGVGSVMTLVNVVVLWSLVGGIGIIPALANLLRTVATTQLHFYLHRRFTWRGVHATSLWQQWYRY
ncbi:MAG TPA: GtrA family protein, partial [Nitrosospira sp.]|nr:GtrA family protein [Nitrosospira sp.]